MNTKMVTMEQMIRDQQKDLERKLQKLQDQQNAIILPLPESKVEKKFEMILQQNTAKIEEAFNYIKDTNEKSLQADLDKLRQNLADFSRKMQHLAESSVSKELMNATNEKFTQMHEKNESVIAKLSEKLEVTI